jgi:two-component system response regulator YesN
MEKKANNEDKIMWKVMIVDDEKLICKLVQALVEWDKLGMQMAAQAENAIQALDMLQQYRPDILITDIRMPGMDGLELIKNAKKICPELEIIIISGYAHFEYARNALSLGVGNYLLKPIKQDELNETLRKIGERLDAKKSAQGMEMAERRVSESDVNRLRYALLKDLVEDAYNPTAVQLQENYYFKAEADCYQAIVVKA